MADFIGKIYNVEDGKKEYLFDHFLSADDEQKAYDLMLEWLWKNVRNTKNTRIEIFVIDEDLTEITT